MSALQRACAERHPEVANQLLLARASIDLIANTRGDPNRQRGLRALHYAARVGPLKTVHLLIGSNASPNVLDTDGLLPLDKVSKLSTRDTQAVRDFLHEQLMQNAVKCGALIRVSDDGKKAKQVFCVLLPLQLCFYSDPNATSQTKGRVDLAQVERLRKGGRQIKDGSASSSKSDKLLNDLDESCSFEIGDSAHTTVLYAESEYEADAWIGLLRGLVEEQAISDGRQNELHTGYGGDAAASARRVHRRRSIIDSRTDDAAYKGDWLDDEPRSRMAFG